MGAAEALGMDDIDIRMIDVGGQVLKVAIKHGPADQPPLLMFNGIGANLELGFPFFAELKGRSGIIFDVPGVGGSPTPALPYRPATLARWAKRLCEILGHEQVDVSGVSWGGGIAQQFARQYPKLCRKLVLSKMASFKRYTDKSYMRSIAAEIYGGDFRNETGHIERHAAGVRPQSQKGYLYQLLAMTGWTSVHWLWTLRQPTLILSGNDDPLIPVENAKLLASLIPNARLVLLDNGHLFIATRPAETAKMIEAFLDEG